MLSPIVLIFALPVAVGVGVDVLGRHGEVPVALALCGPVALAAVGRALPRAGLRRAAAALASVRPHPGRPGLR